MSSNNGSRPGENTKENMDDTAKRLFNEIGGFQLVKNNQALNQKFVDPYATDEQKKRDKEITKLLQYYTDAYEKKSKSNRKYKCLIFWTSILILLSFSLMFLHLLYHYPDMSDTDAVNNMIALITVCITYLTLVIGILKIITKYVFPQNEEEYITRIVKSIQDNDLENKKTNIESAKNT